MEERRTRSLKKYEAAPTVVARQTGQPPLDLLSPFGPMIGKAVMPEQIVRRVNLYCDRVVRPDASSEFLLPPELVFGSEPDTLGARIEDLIRRYVGSVDGVAPGRIVIDAVWVVSQYALSSSPVHFHSGDISGVLYLKTPDVEDEEAEEQKTYISGRRAGYLNFLSGGKQRFAKSLISVKPVVGHFYVFPGWLLHGAEPFRGVGERRSLAFNAVVQEGGG